MRRAPLHPLAKVLRPCHARSVQHHIHWVTVARAIQERKPIQIPDVFADPEFTSQEAAKIGGSRRFRKAGNSVFFRRCAETEYPSLRFSSRCWIGTRQCPSRCLNLERAAKP